MDAQIAQGRYGNVSEYVRELIRADEKRKAEEQLEGFLLEGLGGEEHRLASHPPGGFSPSEKGRKET